MSEQQLPNEGWTKKDQQQEPGLKKESPAPEDHVFERNPFFVDNSAPSRLTPTLYLSGMWSARQHDALKELGITAVVNLTPDDDGCEAAGFKVLRIGIDDAAEMLRPDVTIARFLRQMEEWEASGETVLIHCHAGISRTSVFAIAWLMHRRGCNAQSDHRTMWSACEDEVGAARPIIMPHYLLKRAVLNYFAQKEAA